MWPVTSQAVWARGWCIEYCVTYVVTLKCLQNLNETVNNYNGCNIDQRPITNVIAFIIGLWVDRHCQCT